jgi:urea transport system substrate-binding protein
MDPNHHLHKPVMIGEIRADGQFTVVWKTKGTVRAQPWSPFIPGNDTKPDHLSSIWPADFGAGMATANGSQSLDR